MKKDVFLSYSSRDSERIENIARALEQAGISVWWDREIPPGKTWDAVLGKALDEANCVVVFWTKNSTQSDWVKDEAARGKKRKILVPALLEDVEIPLGFGRIEAADLRQWDGDTSDPEFLNFVAAIHTMLGSENTHISTDSHVKLVQQHHRFKTAYLFIPLLVAVVGYLIYLALQGGSAQLATELWRVESDRKSQMLSSATFVKEAGLDKLENWLVKALIKAAPSGKSPIMINLRVPADLKSDTVQIKTEPVVEITTFIYVTSGESKARVRSPLTQKRLALMEEDFFIEFRRTGYMSEVVKIKIGEGKSKSFELQPKKISVAVEHFTNDRKNLANRLSRRLTGHEQLKVIPPDALENLRQELTDARAAIGVNRAVQTAIRDSLGVDFIVSGAVEKN